MRLLILRTDMVLTCPFRNFNNNTMNFIRIFMTSWRFFKIKFQIYERIDL
jgi:hypothetical protein